MNSRRASDCRPLATCVPYPAHLSCQTNVLGNEPTCKSDLNAKFALAMDKAKRHPFPYTQRDSHRSGSVQAARRGELLRKNQ